MMKKTVSVLLLVSFLFSAAACGGGNGVRNETDGTSPVSLPEETAAQTAPEEPSDRPPQPYRDVIFSIGDQTGHPENSAEKVDVEALLRKDASYDRKKDLEVRFVPQGEPVKDENAALGLIKTEYPTLTNIYANENVRAYGAVGDGRHDDTKAFADALAACSSKGGGVVFVPAGYYCLTSSLRVPHHVGLVGELVPGTASGSVLCLYGGKGKTASEEAALYLENWGTVQNLAFWYPEQTIVNGEAIPYPPTVFEEGGAIELRNLTFVNSYFALDLSNSSLQYTRDIHITALQTGYENNSNIDIGKAEKMVFSADAWLNSGLPGTPNAELLRAYLLKNAVGMILERIDWCYIADIVIDGLKTGVLGRYKDIGVTNGSIYNLKAINCATCLEVSSISWLMITDSVFRTAEGEDSLCIRVGQGNEGHLTLNTCTLESAGDRAILAKGKAVLSMTDCAVSSKGKEAIDMNEKNLRMVNCTVPNTAKAVITDERMPKLVRADYGKDVECKPTSDRVVDLGAEPYSVKTGENIGDRLQQAIDSLKETGGTVYLPQGSFAVERHIDVWAGIELRGVQYWPATGWTRSAIVSDFGKNDPDGESLFTLYDGAGMIGLGFRYRSQNAVLGTPYSFTIRGNGKNIYLIDLSMLNPWNAVDFATYRCDNHYVEYVHSAALAVCFKVGGGSENGIIRDCHNTPNSFTLRNMDDWKPAYDKMNNTGRFIWVENSKNEILYHNFTYAAGQGLTVSEGAENLYSLCFGSDSSRNPVVMDGNGQANLVNSQLVIGIEKKQMIFGSKTYTGEVNFFNVAGWGVIDMGVLLRSPGTVRVIGGIVTTKCGLFNVSGGTGEMYGMIYPIASGMMTASGGAKEIRASGNYCLLDKDFIKVISDKCVKGGSDVG